MHHWRLVIQSRYGQISVWDAYEGVLVLLEGQLQSLGFVSKGGSIVEFK